MEASVEGFEKCHAAFYARAVELHWRNLLQDSQIIALLEEEVRLANEANDKELFWQCAEDVKSFPEGFEELEWEMLRKAAELGHLEASSELADGYYEGFALGGENLDEALRCALEHFERGGEVGDFEYLKLEPRHDCPIDDRMLPWMRKVLEARPKPECKYVLARCHWDIEEVLVSPDRISPTGSEEGRATAYPLYRQAAEEGYFWSQFYFGLYLLLAGEDTATGIAYLEKARANIPDVPDPCDGPEERESAKRFLKETIEKALSSKLGG